MLLKYAQTSQKPCELVSYRCLLAPCDKRKLTWKDEKMVECAPGRVNFARFLSFTRKSFHLARVLNCKAGENANATPAGSCAAPANEVVQTKRDETLQNDRVALKRAVLTRQSTLTLSWCIWSQPWCLPKRRVLPIHQATRDELRSGSPCC